MSKKPVKNKVKPKRAEPPIFYRVGKVEFEVQPIYRQLSGKPVHEVLAKLMTENPDKP